MTKGVVEDGEMRNGKLVVEVYILSIRLLAVVGLPHAIGDLHVGEDSSERGLFRRAGVDAEGYLIGTGKHVADAHLAEVCPVGGAFDAVVVGPAGEAVPHGLDIGGDGRSGPVGPAVVGGDAAKVLELGVLIFHGAFEPVFAVKVQYDAALVEALMALCEVCLHNKAEVLLTGFHLQRGGIVVTEMIIGPLPEIRVRSGCDRNGAVLDFEGSRLPCPLELVKIDQTAACKGIGHAVNEFRAILRGVSARYCQDDQSNAKR